MSHAPTFALRSKNEFNLRVLPASTGQMGHIGQMFWKLFSHAHPRRRFVFSASNLSLLSFREIDGKVWRYLTFNVIITMV